MELEKLYQNLRGYQTVDEIMQKIGVSRNMAIYYVHRLRKMDLVKTMRGREGKRVYLILTKNRYKGYIDMINRKAPEKVTELKPQYVHGREPTAEESLLYAIRKKDVRVLTAALSLFRQITDWKSLFAMAGKESRKVCALYEMARKSIPKIRKMPVRYKKKNLPKADDRYIDIISGAKSKDFGDLEKKWKVRLPFNRNDLEAYK